jgi:hypothetical protein
MFFDRKKLFDPFQTGRVVFPAFTMLFTRKIYCKKTGIPAYGIFRNSRGVAQVFDSGKMWACRYFHG